MNIELNKVYTSGSVFRTPVAVRGDTVFYIFTPFESLIGKEKACALVKIDEFIEDNKLYVKQMTFKRIKDENIKKLVDPNNVNKEVIGFSSNNKLITYTYGVGPSSWYKEQIKDWKVAE